MARHPVRIADASCLFGPKVKAPDRACPVFEMRGRNHLPQDSCTYLAERLRMIVWVRLSHRNQSREGTTTCRGAGLPDSRRAAKKAEGYGSPISPVKGNGPARRITRGIIE